MSSSRRPRLRFLFSAVCLAVAASAASWQSFSGPQPLSRPLSQAAPPRSPVAALAISPDGKQIVAAGQFGIEIHDVPSDVARGGLRLNDPPKNIETALVNIHAVVFSANGEKLAIAGGAPGDSGIVEIYEWPTLRLMATAQPHADLIYDVAWNQDGDQIATASYDRDAKILNVANGPGDENGLNNQDGDAARTLSGHSRPVLSSAWLSDDTTIVTAGVDRSLRVWNAETGALTRSLENHTQTILAIAERPPADEAATRPMILTAGADKTVRFWQPTIGRMVRFAKLESSPLAAVWSTDGSMAIAACEDGALRLIDPQTAEVVDTIQVNDARLETIAVVAAGGEDQGHGDQLVSVGDSDGAIHVMRLPIEQ